MAIDYGQKRIGLAVTDENQIIATGLDTVHVKDIHHYIKDYVQRESVELFVVGLPLQMDDTASESEQFIKPFIGWLRNTFPDIPVERVDERYTSQMAFQAMIDGGAKMKKRRDKALIDKISATIILQTYLESKT
jgi:putative Holliday junction resolvase